jgi:hypothetical protein
LSEIDFGRPVLSEMLVCFWRSEVAVQPSRRRMLRDVTP